MNRLFIIGNGFDIAHGLKTKYTEFINDFWTNVELKSYDDLIYLNPQNGMKPLVKDKINNYSSFIEQLKESIKVKGINIDIFEDYITATGGIGTVVLFKFNNDFFKKITLKTSLDNWVDIESEYYHQLKQIAKELKTESSVSDKNKLESIKKLNKEFQEIKDHFENYLKEKVQPNIHQNLINNEILNLFDVEEHKSGGILKSYLNEFPKEDHEILEEENELLKGFYTSTVEDKIIRGELNSKTILLNFNYTTLIDEYIKLYKHALLDQIQIHGKIDDEYNKINFGFGDEMDEDYKMIENLNENEFLNNFKSFGYSQNSNYRKLLDFIESDKFQVIIMGHSCGTSDRIMLNTIFEHNNCRSIKPFYYQKKNNQDNYIEIIQEISRHFDKKDLMRKKLVNKSLCKPLPQQLNTI